MLLRNQPETVWMIVENQNAPDNFAAKINFRPRNDGEDSPSS
jgi:hypothetical protein